MSTVIPPSLVPSLGFGLGLRPTYYTQILQEHPPIDWFEALTENYLVPGGKPLYYLQKIREQYPVVLHGVSLSIGGCDPLNWEYLRQVKALCALIRPAWISDHLCWTGVDGINAHDLLPLPYTLEALEHVAERVRQVQDFLERPLLLENVSSYLQYQASTMTEWDFLRGVAESSNCLILLDINNIYVTAFNQGFDPKLYLEAMPPQRVQQFHLAGHRRYPTHIIDTHDDTIIEGVWELYRQALRRFPQVSTMIERDDHFPPLEELLGQLHQARQWASSAEVA